MNGTRPLVASRSRLVRKIHVGAEISSSDDTGDSALDAGPPLCIYEGFTPKPIRDELLCRPLTSGGPHTLSELSLASGMLDSPLEGDNVVSLFSRHAHNSTRNLVKSNNNLCLTSDKEFCTVLPMAQAKKKPKVTAPKKVSPRTAHEPEAGPDGLTMPQRVMKLMTEHGVGQSELARMCSERYAVYFPGTEAKVQQQHIFNLLRGASGKGQSSSWILPLLALVFDVSDIWLQFGVGKRDRHTTH